MVEDVASSDTNLQVYVHKLGGHEYYATRSYRKYKTGPSRNPTRTGEIFASVSKTTRGTDLYDVTPSGRSDGPIKVRFGPPSVFLDFCRRHVNLSTCRSFSNARRKAETSN